MTSNRRISWLRVLRGTALVGYICALCLAVAVTVIAFIPGSAVHVALPASLLSGLDGIGGLVRGAVVDPAGRISVLVADPSLGQRLLMLGTTLPGLLVVAEVARRMSRLLRAAEETDPFTASTVTELSALAKITAFGGLAAWVIGAVATGVLSTTVLTSGAAVKPEGSPAWWLGAGLIFWMLGQLIARGVAMRTELDAVI